MQAPFADPLLALAPGKHLLPLVGRESEMSIIHALLDTVAYATSVGARSLIMSGEIGVGKTRLLAEMFADAKPRGFRLLESRAYESWGAFPYLPFIEALRPVIRSTPRETLCAYLGLDSTTPAASPPSASQESRRSSASVSLTGPSLAGALARLFPELPDLLRVTIVPETLSQDQEKFRLFDAIATLLERMSLNSPVLLGIDDLQWADSASLELTMYLTVRLHTSRVALVGVTRPPGATRVSTSLLETESDGAGPSPATALKALGELMRQGLLRVLPLGPLHHEAVEQHLHALLPGFIPGDVAASLIERAEGNPFFLEELVRMLSLSATLVLSEGTWRLTRAPGSALPASIATAVEQRLQSLTASCLEALRIASLFGRSFPLSALAAVMHRQEEQAQASIDEAVQASLLIRDSAPGEHDETELLYASTAVYMFSQSIVQEVLSSQLPAYLARELHGAIGTALEALYGEQAIAAELARHYSLGDRGASALQWSIRAGEHALRQQAYREAIAHFRAALRLAEKGVLPTQGKLPLPAQLRFWIGQSWFKLGELHSAMEELQQALEQSHAWTALGVVDALAPLLMAQINRMISDIYRMQGKYELAFSHLRVARDAIDALNRPGHAGSSSTAANLTRVDMAERILLYQAQATLDLLLMRAEAAEAALWRSHQLAVEIGDRESQAFALHLVGWIRGWGEHIHEAIRLQQQAYSLYASIGDPFRAALVDQGLGIIYQSLGEMEQARLHTLRGLEQARRYGVRHVLGWLYWNQGIMALAEGNWAACESHFEQVMQEAELTDNARLKPLLLQGQAELFFRKGDWQRAEPLFQASVQAAINTEWHTSAMAMYGHFLAVTGRRAEARIQLERAVALPEPVGYSGHFYIPFLAEGFLHLERDEQANTYIERIRALRGFMYYGVAVDRIRGEVATQAGDWEMAERAFEDGLTLCRNAHNEPEEAAILYEQARMELARSSKQKVPGAFARIYALCEQAGALFSRYNMSRAVMMVDTLRDGVRQLAVSVSIEPGKPATFEKQLSEGYMLDQKLTRREQEVLRLVAQGHTDREVAESLVISHRTVNRHLSNIFVKLDVPGRAAAVAFAIRQGLVA